MDAWGGYQTVTDLRRRGGGRADHGHRFTKEASLRGSDVRQARADTFARSHGRQDRGAGARRIYVEHRDGQALNERGVATRPRWALGRPNGNELAAPPEAARALVLPEKNAVSRRSPSARYCDYSGACLAFARSLAGTIAELEREGITSSQAMARTLNELGVATPRAGSLGPQDSDYPAASPEAARA